MGMIICMPISSEEKNHGLEVRIKNKKGIGGIILCDHVKSLDWKERRAEFICKCDTESFEAALAKLKLIIDD